MPDLYTGLREAQLEAVRLAQSEGTTYGVIAVPGVPAADDAPGIPVQYDVVPMVSVATPSWRRARNIPRPSCGLCGCSVRESDAVLLTSGDRAHGDCALRASIDVARERRSDDAAE